jgi:glycosyltransferase involved in cell wall biosynthesis
MMQRAKHIATSTPLWPASYFSAAFDVAVDKLLAEQKFDVAHVSDLRCASVGRRINGRIPSIYDTEFCVSETDSQDDEESNGNSLGGFFTRHEQSKLSRYEPKVAAMFDRILTSTTTDKESLKNLGSKIGTNLHIDVVPNGVDLSVYYPVESAPTPGNIVLSGKLHYEANRDAAYYFASEIFPGIRQTHPSSYMTFVGPIFIQGSRYAVPTGPGIEILEDVVDMRIPFFSAAIIACPVRVGIGTKTNILEAMAMAKAVIASPLGVRSLFNPKTGDVICVADTPLSFATQIVHLLSHPEEVARLSQNAREYVRKYHDWVTIGKRLVHIYEEVIEHEKGPVVA